MYVALCMTSVGADVHSLIETMFFILVFVLVLVLVVVVVVVVVVCGGTYFAYTRIAVEHVGPQTCPAEVT